MVVLLIPMPILINNLAKFLSKRNDNNFYFLGLSGDGSVLI